MSRFIGASRLVRATLNSNQALLSNQKPASCILHSIRFSSTEDKLPVAEITDKVSSVVDPPFVELGLADGWMPYNFVEGLFETLHTTTGLPWWATITLATVAMRTVTFPIFVNSRKYTTRMSNHGSKTSVSLNIFFYLRCKLQCCHTVSLFGVS